MSTLRDKHLEAMDLAEEADRTRRRGDETIALELYRQAMRLEMEAASLSQTEPTRSILYRSAAYLALDGNEYSQAEKLAALGLSGDPPTDIARELRHALERASLDLHLALRGVQISRRELQLSIVGDAVGPGIIENSVFMQRMKDFEILAKRTAQRVRGQEFREARRLPSDLANEFDLYLSAARAGSFTVTVQFGIFQEPVQEYLPVPGLGNFDDVIDSLLDCLELVNQGNERALRELIPSPAYYNSFIGVAQRFAPDGRKVSAIGITRGSGGQKRELMLTRNRDELTFSPQEVARHEELLGRKQDFEGVLLYADNLAENSQIKLKQDNGKVAIFNVPEGYMDDIVRPLWNTRVRAVGARIGRRNRYLLSTIQSIEDGG